MNRALKHWALLLKLPAYHEMGYVFTASSAAKFFLKALFDELDRLEAVFGSPESLLAQAFVQKTIFPTLPLPMPPLPGLSVDTVYKERQGLAPLARAALALPYAQDVDADVPVSTPEPKNGKAKAPRTLKKTKKREASK